MKRIWNTLLLSLMSSGVTFADNSLVFSQLKDTPDQVIGARILQVAYAKIGFDISFVNLPGKRALKESSAGRLDGEVHRILRIEKAYPHLVRVPTAINYIEPSVFAINTRFVASTCSALKDYTVGIVGGVKHAEICTKYVKKVHVFGYSTTMMDLLHLDKIDFAITAKINGLLLAKHRRLDNVRALSPPLSKMLVYHYLNEKHKDLVPKINKVFLEMQKSGELERIRNAEINKLLGNTL